MSNDLLAWIVAITLGVAVVVLGLRRNLSDITRNGLPRFEEAPEQAAVRPGPGHHEQRRRPLSKWQRRWFVGVYLLLSLGNAARVVLSADERTPHAIGAAMFALCAVVFFLRRSPSSLDGSTS